LHHLGPHHGIRAAARRAAVGLVTGPRHPRCHRFDMDAASFMHPSLCIWSMTSLAVAVTDHTHVLGVIGLLSVALARSAARKEEIRQERIERSRRFRPEPW
jgi:hypothetical protein